MGSKTLAAIAVVLIAHFSAPQDTPQRTFT